MKVIALKGPVNSGKSHTINIVYSFLLRDNYVQIGGHFRELGNQVFEDILDILEGNGIRIGIIGMGDYQQGANSLNDLIEELSLEGCVVIICACTDRPGIVNSIAHWNPIFVDKSLSAGRPQDRIVNVNDAEAVLAHL